MRGLTRAPQIVVSGGFSAAGFVSKAVPVCALTACLIAPASVGAEPQCDFPSLTASAAD